MITASIVLYNSNPEEVRTIIHCTDTSSVEKIYVIDNSPSAVLEELVGSLSEKTTYIHGHGNIGYGAGHNIAIKLAIQEGAAYHVVLNPDIYFRPGTIEALVQYMRANSRVGQIMPKIVYPNEELQYLCKLLPKPIDLIGRAFLPTRCIQKRNDRFEMRASGYNKIIEVPFLSGCFMFLRVDALIKTGGFSDRYFMYCEDLDLCRRIGVAGYQIIYYPYITAVHAHKKESFVNKRLLLEHIKSATKYFNHWGWFFDKYRRRFNKKAEKQYQ